MVRVTATYKNNHENVNFIRAKRGSSSYSPELSLILSPGKNGNEVVLFKGEISGDELSSCC